MQMYRARLLGITAAVVAALVTGTARSGDGLLASMRSPTISFEFGKPFTSPREKSLSLITCGAIGEGCQKAAEAAAAAASELGWKTRIIDGKFDPSVWNQAVQQAVADGSDGIILFAVPLPLIQGGLDAAKGASVPVINVFQPQLPGAPEIDAYITGDHVKGGKATAELITSDSGGSGHVLLLDVPEFPEIMLRNDALADELKKICPGCSLSRQTFNGALASQRLAPLVASRLQQDTAINYIVGPYDPAGPFILNGIRQAQRSENVKYLSFEGVPIGFTQMANGEQFADISVALGFSGWMAVDTMARILAGVDHPKMVDLPQRVFLASDELPETPSWELDFDYKAQLKGRWQR